MDVRWAISPAILRPEAYAVTFALADAARLAHEELHPLEPSPG